MAEKSDGRVVILCGRPGSGKSTQATILKQSLGLPRISTGDLLRTHTDTTGGPDHVVGALLDSGVLVADETVNCVVAKRIDQVDCARGFVLDGYPRTVNQAVVLGHIFQSRSFDPVVVHLDVDPEIAVARLSGRQQCESCGKIYHSIFNPTKTPGACDQDGSRLIRRSDDCEDAVRARLRIYEAYTLAALDLLRRVVFRCVDLPGVNPPAAIARLIVQAIG